MALLPPRRRAAAIRGMRRIAALGVGGPGGLHGHRGPQRRLGLERHPPPDRPGLEVPVTIYPPFVLSLLAAVWLGPTWGLVPAYTANLASAVTAGSRRGRRFSSPSPAPSRSSSSGARWSRSTSAPSCGAGATSSASRLVCLIAPDHRLAGRAHLEHRARPRHRTAGLRVWQGWVFGDILQALLVVAPLLRFAGPRARAWIDHQFATPPRYEVTYTRAAMLAAVTFSLIAVLVFVGHLHAPGVARPRPHGPHPQRAAARGAAAGDAALPRRPGGGPHDLGERLLDRARADGGAPARPLPAREPHRLLQPAGLLRAVPARGGAGPPPRPGGRRSSSSTSTTSRTSTTATATRRGTASCSSSPPGCAASSGRPTSSSAGAGRSS